MPEDILVQTCCAPCAVAVNDKLATGPLAPHVFFYNPNIHPEKEYYKRKETLDQYLEITGYPLITCDDYAPQVFFDRLAQEAFKSFIDQTIDIDSGKKMRCTLCYDTRLEAAAETAWRLGYRSFTSTLLYSIYQDHELIKKIALEKARKYRVRFHYEDFRKLWKQGHEKASQMGLYSQKYCGCLYSWYERERAQQIRQRERQLAAKS